MLDDALLSDESRLIAADHDGILRAVATAGAQVRATAEAAREAGVHRELAGLRPRALVLLTRPGTTESACRLMAALLTPTAPLPVIVSGVAPPWLGPLDVVVATHRGREGDPVEADVAESVHRAVRRGAHVVLTGPGEGPAAAAGAGRALAVTPRMTVGVPGEDLDGLDTATVLATGLAVAGALELLDLDLDDLADRLDAEAERDGPRGEAFVNPAKSLALRLAERTPLLWGADPVAGLLAGYGATVLATHAGVVAQATTAAAAGAQPALRARLVESSGEASIFADPFDDPAPAAPPPRLVLLAVREDLTTRRLVSDVGARHPGADVLEIDDVELAGEGPSPDALRAAVLATRLDFTAVYLGLALGARAPGVRTA
ncbi:phosphoglucose isomerase-like protein [Actinomycetospora succinea]|uniref:Phosphoglucose isomerase-like protein n=1 Tax=Actinomycetospora succinea TaxID=663603 RepID=A0A4R6VMJ4_9PSEU|nr:SIS domain-containing protein [Actinomycetospora succinea]TDQ64999.1 phosphoglucose isomerase-like protein [Actinomycetospora succinea]